MRLAWLAAAALLLSGCSDGGTPDDEATPQEQEQAPAGSVQAGMMPPEASEIEEVEEDVEYSATFNPNACLVGSCVVGGIGALYMHEETDGDLAAGRLHVQATPTAPNEVLHVLVGVYEDCDGECDFVTELAATEGTGAMDLEVPAHDLGMGQRIGVRFSPIAPVGVAFGTAGWTVELSGSLTFAQSA